MGKIQDKLREYYIQEFDTLVNYFVREAKRKKWIPNDWVEDRTLGSINQLVTKTTGLGPFSDDKDLFNGLQKPFRFGNSEIVNAGGSLLFIPLFRYFLNNCASDNLNDFYDMCLRIHLTPNKKDVFKGKNLFDLRKIPFSFSDIEDFDKILDTPDYSVSLETVVRFLEFIDYEFSINRRNNISRLLKGVLDDLMAYISFTANDDLFEQIVENRRDGRIGKYDFGKNPVAISYNLMDTFVGYQPGRNRRNEFLKFLDWERKLKSASNLVDRKNNMMVAFTYRPYSIGNKFYEDFTDVSLDVEDLVNFIKMYDDRARSLTPRQFDNLLRSFRLKWAESRGMADEYLGLEEKVLVAFDEYRKTGFAFKPQDFIDYFNKKFPNVDFKCFNFGEVTGLGLTREVYEVIINGNYLSGLDAHKVVINEKDLSCLDVLRETATFTEYVKAKRFRKTSQEEDEKFFAMSQEIVSRFQSELTDPGKTEDITKRYFVRRNGLKDDEDRLALFNSYVQWIEKYCFEGKRKVFPEKVCDSKVFLSDYVEAFKNSEDKSPFGKTYRVFYSWAKEDGIVLSKNVLLDALIAAGCTVEKSDMPLTDEEISTRLLLGFVGSKKTFNDYCEDNGITPIQYIEALYNDSSSVDGKIESLLWAKMNGVKSKECSDDEIVSIAAAMLNGVESNDSSAMRHFYLFDYYTKTNMPFDEFVKRVKGLKARILDEASSQVANNRSVIMGNRGYQIALSTENADVLVDYVKGKCDTMSANINYNARFLVSNVLNENTIIRKNGEDIEVTREEKIDALVWMMEHGLPNCVGLYKSVVRGIVDGHIKVGDTQNLVGQTMGESFEFVKKKTSGSIGSAPANT